MGAKRSRHAVRRPHDGNEAVAAKAWRPRAGAGEIARRVLTFALVVMLVAGVGLIAYPTVADVWNKYHQSRAVATYVEEVNAMGVDETARLLALGDQYNRELAATPRSERFDRSDEKVAAYNKVLDITGTGIMGYVTIPSIGVRLPVYHGTDDAVLQIAVGHLYGTSLPVGGESAHAVVSGHTGLPSAKLLTELDRVKEGEIFQFHVLDRVYTYEVDQIKVVLPDELDDIQIERNRDLATLVTCTPYGVNSHRLLVRGHRVANPSEPDTTDYDRLVRMVQWTAAGLAALVVLLVAALIVWRRLRRAKAADGSGWSLEDLPGLFGARFVAGSAGRAAGSLDDDPPAPHGDDPGGGPDGSTDGIDDVGASGGMPGAGETKERS